MIRPENPTTREEIIQAINNVHDDLANFYAEMSTVIFINKPAEGWSPAENLKHLIKTGVAINLAFSTPKFLLRLVRTESRHIYAKTDAISPTETSSGHSGALSTSTKSTRSHARARIRLSRATSRARACSKLC